MSAILKREFKAYFRTPLGCIFISVMYFFTAYYFFTDNLYAGTANMSSLFSKLFSVVLFLVPILTMRLLSEEKRTNTEQLLLTAPVSRLDIVLGKYFAAFLVYLMGISGTLVMSLVLTRYARPELPVILGNFIGLILLGLTILAICLFVSALTESQVIAAVMGMAVSLFLILIDSVRYVVSNDSLRTFLSYLSFTDRYNGFTIGVIDFSNVLFFLSIATLFLCLTVAVLERRRWN